MKQGTNNRRSRSRGGGGKRQYGGGGRNSFESNGPDVKIRGTAQQIQDKYLSLARDASSSGDWVSAEAYFQFAEHYHRIINSNAGNGAGKNVAQGQNKNQSDSRNSGKNITNQESSAIQPDSKSNIEKTTEDSQEGEAEVIDTSPAALAAAVAARENADVEKSAEPETEMAPKKAVS